jgi:tetratricopeptide (TPR) repeat protein
VNSDKDIQKAVDGIVLFRLNSEKGEGKTLAKEFTVKYLPTFAMVDVSGARIDRWLGYSKSEFLGNLAAATSDMATVDDKLARFQAKPDAKTAAALGRYSAGMVQYKDAVTYYTKAEELKSDSTVDYTFDIFQNISEGVGSKDFTYDDARNAANAYMALPTKTNQQTNNIYGIMIQLAKSNNQQEDLAKYLQDGLDFTAKSDDSDMKKEHADLMVDYAIYVKKDTAAAVVYKKATMPDGWTTDSGNLNEFAWWCFTIKANLGEAEQLARKAVELAKPGKGRSNIYDTLAEIVNAEGNPKEAAELSKKSAADDPDNKYFPKQVTRFEELANAKGK